MTTIEDLLPSAPSGVTYEKVAEFPAWQTNFKSAPRGEWRIEFGLSSIFKDEAWAVSDDEGLELVVVVLSKRFVGVAPDEDVLGVVEDLAIPRIAPASEDVPVRRAPAEVFADAERRIGKPIRGVE